MNASKPPTKEEIALHGAGTRLTNAVLELYSLGGLLAVTTAYDRAMKALRRVHVQGSGGWII